MNLIMYQTFLNTFCVSSLMCFFVDIFAPHYRVNNVSRETIFTDYQNMLPRVAGNLVISYPYFYIVEKYITQIIQPNTYSLLTNIALWVLLMDIMFYSIHRAFHCKYLYHYHSIHHTYRYTYGMGAIYAHWIEFIVANLIPISVPMLLFKFPFYICNNIVLCATFYTVVISHGGFKIPLSGGHLYHHLKYKYNFGLFRMDHLMKTNYLC
mgnify:CR=1 FL=1